MSAQFRSAIGHTGKLILSAGHNLAVLRSRNALIETAGYQVVTTRESALVVELARRQHFDAVVLCNSLPSHLRVSIARDLKKAMPTLPIIVICTAAERQHFQGLVQEIVDAEHGVSQPLLEAISRKAGEPDAGEAVAD